jgi:hypothetical protein
VQLNYRVCGAVVPCTVLATAARKGVCLRSPIPSFAWLLTFHAVEAVTMRISPSIRRHADLHRDRPAACRTTALASPQKVRAFVFLRAACHSFL